MNMLSSWRKAVRFLAVSSMLTFVFIVSDPMEVILSYEANNANELLIWFLPIVYMQFVNHIGMTVTQFMGFAWGNSICYSENFWSFVTSEGVVPDKLKLILIVATMASGVLAMNLIRCIAFFLSDEGKDVV